MEAACAETSVSQFSHTTPSILLPERLESSSTAELPSRCSVQTGAQKSIPHLEETSSPKINTQLAFRIKSIDGLTSQNLLRVSSHSSKADRASCHPTSPTGLNVGPLRSSK